MSSNKYQQKLRAEAAAATAAAMTSTQDTAATEAPTPAEVVSEVAVATPVNSEVVDAVANANVKNPDVSVVINPTQVSIAALVAEKATAGVVEPTAAALERFGGHSTVALMNIDFLTQYAEEMHPSKPINSDRTRRNQRTLLRTIKTAIGLPKAEDMIAVLDALLKLITEHRSAAFSEYYVFRDLANVELSQEEISQFTQLLHLFMVLSDPTERKSYSKTVDVPLVTKWILDEQVRSRFLAYCTRVSSR